MNNVELIRAGHARVTRRSSELNGYGLARPPRKRPRAAQQRPGDLQRVIALLLKHWRASALFAGATATAVALATFLMRPVYEPEGRLQIDPPGAEVFSLEATSGAITDSEYISTEAAKLQTEDVELATIRALHLDHSPELVGKAGSANGSVIDGVTPLERAALRGFRTNFSVGRTPGSRLVAVRFASHDPELSARIVNTAMRLFVERNYQARHDEILQSSTWLARQLDDIREKMDKSSQQLADFQQANGIADVADNSNTIAQQVGDLNKQLADAQAQRIQLEAYLNRVNTGDSLPQVNSNPVIQALTQKRAEVTAELAQTRVIYGPNHPNVRKLESQGNELERQLRNVRANQAAELKTSYAAAKAREELLQNEVKSATERLSHMEQYTNLKKEAAADRELYDNLYAKIKEAGIAAASKSSNIRVVENATVLDHPTRPHRAFNLLAGLLLGVLGGVGPAFVKEGLEDRVHTADDIRASTGMDSIAVIPAMGRLPQRNNSVDGAQRLNPLVPSRALIERPHSPESEAIAALRTSLLLSRSSDNTARVLLITSPLPGEGKTTVASNLATALAKHGKTCLVDCDMRRPSAAAAFRLPPSKGLPQYLRGQASLDEVLYPAPGVDRLTVLASWTPSDEAAELLTVDNMSELIALLRERFDFVLIDTPPILPYSDGRVLSTLAEGVILVARSASTPRSAINRTMELLSEVRSAPILSVVLNGADYTCADYRYCYGYR